jgi:hypothetical protein
MDAGPRKLGQVVSQAIASITPSDKRALVTPITSKANLPQIFDRATDLEIPDRVAMFWFDRTDGDKGTPLLRRALVPAERSALEKRRSELQQAIAPAPARSRDTLLDEISGMLGAFPMMQRHDRNTAKMIAASYLWTVRDEPHWAIVDACLAVRGNQAGLNPSFPPTEPEFATVVKRSSSWYRKKLRETDAILDAKVIENIDAPKLSKEELEKLLGRPISEAQYHARKPACDPGYAERVRKDLAMRRARALGRQADKLAAEHEAQS